MVLHIYKDLTHDLDLKDIGNEYYAKSDYPKAVSSILESVTLMTFICYHEHLLAVLYLLVTIHLKFYGFQKFLYVF